MRSFVTFSRRTAIMESARLPCEVEDGVEKRTGRNWRAGFSGLGPRWVDACSRKLGHRVIDLDTLVHGMNIIRQLYRFVIVVDSVRTAG